jgi:hypothetical protein
MLYLVFIYIAGSKKLEPRTEPEPRFWFQFQSRVIFGTADL